MRLGWTFILFLLFLPIYAFILAVYSSIKFIVRSFLNGTSIVHLLCSALLKLQAFCARDMIDLFTCGTSNPVIASPMAVFDGVRYWLAESLPPDRRALNSNYLNLNGGEPADNIDAATHIITNTYQFQGWKRLDDGELDAAVVTVRLYPSNRLIFYNFILQETWVDRSIVLGKAQPYARGSCLNCDSLNDIVLFHTQDTVLLCKPCNGLFRHCSLCY